MAKANPDKVHPVMARKAMEKVLASKKPSVTSAYSECVRLSYNSSGRMNCGFDNKDLIEWYKLNMLDEYILAGGK